MTNCFDKHPQLALSELVLIPSVLLKSSLDDATTQIADVGKMYTYDLPFYSCLHGELHTWHLKWTEDNSRGSAYLQTTVKRLCHTPLQCFQTLENYYVSSTLYQSPTVVLNDC
uniref:Uncharacterized protein n=1 Tax=Amphimedon queenslandica TaxID=400682 RepID=A0A1X7VYD3_AMPQE